ncbi:hypothetical protein ScPMuIL_016923 [Solemya velum]
MANSSTHSLLLLSSLMAIVSSFSIQMPDVFGVVGSELVSRCTTMEPSESFRGEYTLEMYVDGKREVSTTTSHPLRGSIVSNIDTSSVRSGTMTCTISDKSSSHTETAKYGVREIPNTPQSVSVDCRGRSVLSHGERGFLKNSDRFETQWEGELLIPSFSQQRGNQQSTKRIYSSNPQHVESRGNETGYLTIRWQAMPQIVHNGEGLRYIVTYRKADHSSLVKTMYIPDWTITEKKIQTGDVYTPYEVTVSAANNMGTSTKTAETHTLYSSESAPNVSVPLLEIGRVEPHRVFKDIRVSVDYIWKWNSQLEEGSSMNGAFRGFRIEHWLPYGWEDPHSKELLPRSRDPSSTIENVSISKNDMQQVADCGSPDGFYHKQVHNLRIGHRYKSHITVQNTYFHGPVTTVMFRADHAEVENLRTDCCHSLQKTTKVSWDMYEDRINPDGIQGRLLAFNILLSHNDSNDGSYTVNVNDSIPIAKIARVAVQDSLVTFSTVLEGLSLDTAYSLHVTPVRERCDWSVTQQTSFQTDAVMSMRSNFVAIASALILYHVIS